MQRAAVNTREPTHLATRDRLALVFRVAGAVFGFAVIVAAFVTSSWDNGWVMGLCVAVTVGGPVSYHLLTSIVRCPACANGLFNFGVGSEDTRRKTFECGRCGATAWLAEGLYWQEDSNG